MSEEARPPYVNFEYRSTEDRTASIEAGHFVSKDVVFALVTPAGTRDVIEKPAEDWINGLKEAAQQERIPASWPDIYKEALDRWIKNQEDPEFGTSIKNWPALSRSQVTNILNANIRTVEDLAEATEEALGRIGMGAQALKSKAISWLKTAQSTGKVAENSAALQQENAELKASNEELRTRMAELEATVKSLSAKEKA